MRRILRTLRVLLVTRFTHCRPDTKGIQVKAEMAKDFCEGETLLQGPCLPRIEGFCLAFWEYSSRMARSCSRERKIRRTLAFPHCWIMEPSCWGNGPIASCPAEDGLDLILSPCSSGAYSNKDNLILQLYSEAFSSPVGPSPRHTLGWYSLPDSFRGWNWVSLPRRA